MIKIINDLHAGVRRQAGTTMNSRQELNSFINMKIRQLLESCSDADVVVVLGDIFDKPKVSELVLFDVYILFLNFLKSSSADLVLVRGNHDNRSERVDDMCSLELLYSLLINSLMEAGDDTTRLKLIYNEPEEVYDDSSSCMVIPHVYDQQTFDEILSKINTTYYDYLLLHCNFDFHYAVGDHSLNLSREQAKEIISGGTQIIIAHEHQFREPVLGLTVIGNQFPTSIADCKDRIKKVYMTLNDQYTYSFTETWSPKGSYLNCKYPDIEEAEFVRIHGSCNSSEFGNIVRDISEFRKNSDALIVSNAVKVSVRKTSISKEDVTNINIIDMLMSALPEKFRERVKECSSD